MGLVLPAIADVATAFDVPATSATWVATAPSVAMIPVTVLTGMIAGRRLRYRPLVLSATALYVVAGVLPIVIDDFWWLVGSRVLWGAATGVLLTAANNLVVLTAGTAVRRARLFALANTVFSVGAVASLVLGGRLAAHSWSAPMWGHLVGLPALLVLAIWLREPAAPPAVASGRRAQIPRAAYVPMAVFVVIVMCVYPVSTLMSVVFQQAAIGDPGTVGVVGSLLTLTGLVVAPAFGRLYSWLGARVLACSTLVCGVGLVVVVAATPTAHGSLPLYGAGLVVTGAGLMGATISLPVITSTIVPPEAGGTAQGLVAAALNVGGLLSSGYAGLIVPWLGGGGTVRPVYLVSAGLLLVLAIPLWSAGRLHPALRRSAPAVERDPVARSDAPPAGVL
ncbi:MFS transporter [Actinotalea subterranea]|uniref:MFS transporter n=1 Tax=Actinotalea subterranea TaxID=2607497 RepID=UPI00165E8C34